MDKQAYEASVNRALEKSAAGIKQRIGYGAARLGRRFIGGLSELPSAVGNLFRPSSASRRVHNIRLQLDDARIQPAINNVNKATDVQAKNLRQLQGAIEDVNGGLIHTTGYHNKGRAALTDLSKTVRSDLSNPTNMAKAEKLLSVVDPTVPKVIPGDPQTQFKLFDPTVATQDEVNFIRNRMSMKAISDSYKNELQKELDNIKDYNMGRQIVRDWTKPIATSVGTGALIGKVINDYRDKNND